MVHLNDKRWTHTACPNDFIVRAIAIAAILCVHIQLKNALLATGKLWIRNRAPPKNNQAQNIEEKS